MAKKVVKREITKHARALNKLKLAKAIDLKKGLEDLTEDFLSTIEEIDDDGKIGKVSGSILDYYDAIFPEEEEETKEETEEEPEDMEDKIDEMDLKEFREFCKEKELDLGRITKRNLEDKKEEALDALEGEKEEKEEVEEEEEFDPDELMEKLEEMSIKEVRAFVKENSLDVGRITGKNIDDKLDEIVDAMEEKAEGGEEEVEEDDSPDFDGMDEDDLLDFADDNDIPLTAKEEDLPEKKLRAVVKKKYTKIVKGGGTKGKDKKSTSSDVLPGKLRKDTAPGDIYETVRDNPGISLHDLTEPWAEKQDKEPKQVYGWVNRQLSRVISKSVKVTATYPSSGVDGDITYEV